MDQLDLRRYYLGSVVDIIAFLSVNKFPLRRDHDRERHWGVVIV
jgi:hypothetical protein